MDPLSIVAGVVGILDTVAKLTSAISQFKHDYKVADEDLNIARNHALLLKEEIRGLESRASSNYSHTRKSANEQHNHSGMEADASFSKAMSTARDLLADIEASFPLRSEPHTWRSKVRWAIKDKQALAQLKQRLQSAESTLQAIVTMEQLRVSNLIYGMLLQQQPTMEKIERGDLLTQKVFNMAFNSNSTQVITDSEVAESKATTQQSTQIITRPSKLLPKTSRFGKWGFSVQVASLPKVEGTKYRAAVHISLLGKLYSAQLHMSCPDLSFDHMMHVRNVVPTDSDMAVACRAGDFDSARKLLANGLAHGNDITSSGWPMLDYAINSGSARLVRLLLDHGAEADIAYGDHDMTALQSSFLRGKIDIARILLSRGANLEHVDSDGYSVLSYLWVVDGKMDESVDFMRLCQANGFSEVNACDNRGWTAFHRAAAVGTPEDVEAFLQLGASLDLRAEWYGWTALFFAASHDNVDTFKTIVKHSGPNVYESLDGDGWTLLHCCVYFGAPRVMKLILQNGLDVNQKSLPAPLPEDPELSYRELTPTDIAHYIGPNRYQMFMDVLAETGRDTDLEEADDYFWDAADLKARLDDVEHEGRPIYGAEDIDDRWTLLHWASYNGSPKVKRLFLLKGADPEHLDAIMLEDNPTVLPTSPFEGRN